MVIKDLIQIHTKDRTVLRHKECESYDEWGSLIPDGGGRSGKPKWIWLVEYKQYRGHDFTENTNNTQLEVKKSQRTLSQLDFICVHSLEMPLPDSIPVANFYCSREIKK